MRMLDLLNQIDAIVWGPWLLVLLVGTGIYLTIRLRLLQMVKLPRALRLIFFARNKGDGDIDSFKALCTALAATVGTGNIVGVATAIKLGGPGALFWMWVAAFFGMATKYAEGCLAVKFRSIDENGNIAGGPMYYIEQGLGKKWKPLALAFAFFGTLTAMLGSGTTTQVNAITSSLQASLGVPILCSSDYHPGCYYYFRRIEIHFKNSGKNSSCHGCSLFYYHGGSSCYIFGRTAPCAGSRF